MISRSLEASRDEDKLDKIERNRGGRGRVATEKRKRRERPPSATVEQPPASITADKEDKGRAKTVKHINQFWFSRWRRREEEAEGRRLERRGLVLTTVDHRRASGTPPL
ncbi:hypothetical protein U1Q18_036690 [Sarracenia purpurea var. burkii]